MMFDRPLTADVRAAVAQLEAADDYESVAGAYRIARAEADRRAPVVAALMIATALIGAGLIWAAQGLGWLPKEAPWAYAFGPVLFTAIVISGFRPRASRDEARLGKALSKWKSAAKRTG